RKKLSGAEYRKRKAIKEANLKKQAGALKKFLRRDYKIKNLKSRACLEDEEATVAPKVVAPGEGECRSDSEESSSSCGNDNVSSRTASAASPSPTPIPCIISSDAVLWPCSITDNIRQIIVEQGPNQVKDLNFPQHGGRWFPVSSYMWRLRNSEEVHREWLVYSVSKNSVFCFCCKLCSTCDSLLIPEGYANWKHIHTALRQHEMSTNHLDAYKSWIELCHRLRFNKTIDSSHQRILQAETRHWNDVLQRLLAVSTYLGKTIQNEFISLSSSKLTHKAKYYSIICDCTRDISYIEQMTMINRFVKCEACQQVKIHEHFLGFIPVTDSPGFGLTEVILDQLKEMGLQLKDMGQGYDNGSNMKGKYAGVQKQILEKNPRALFVLCSSHSLNLVVSDAAVCSRHVVFFFSLLQEIYVFFSSSSYRWAVLKEHVSNFTVKPLSTTRWESRVDAVHPIMYQLGEVYDDVLSIANDTSKDLMTRHEAVAGKMLDFQFLCTLAIWHKVLNQVNIANKLLQSPDFDLPATIKVLDDAVTFLSDEGFQSVIEEAKQLAQVIGMPPELKQTSQIRPRHKKKQFDYEAEDEPIQDPELDYKVNCFYSILDTAHTSVSERFQQLHEVCQSFHFLYDISGLNNLSATVGVELLKKCKDLQVYLSHGNNADIDALELFDEL
uniref:DUF4371 domain-containing protein n=1 Tax=Latimeria chalumnae TaxID=7897 RepID=H3AHC0_LATCH